MPDYNLLIRLLIAHAISDFALQPKKWASEKDQFGFFSRYFYYHIGVTGVMTYLACASVEGWNCIVLALVLTAFHFAIDSSKYLIFSWHKTRSKKDITLPGFLIDQLVHLLVITLVWLQYTGQFAQFGDVLEKWSQNEKMWIIVLGLTAVTFPASIFTHIILTKWNLIGKEGKKDKRKFSRNESGKWVGIVERLLIYCFIIIGRYEIIGFLIAAKSIFRYQEIKTDDDQRRIEYLITGTMISFCIAIACGLPVRYYIVG